MKKRYQVTTKNTSSAQNSKKPLSNVQIKWLRKLDSLIQNCKRCRLYEGGGAKPYWTKYSKYAIIGETPWHDEIEQNEPFVGLAGKYLWIHLKKLGLHKKDFLVINAANCKPIKRKPSSVQIQLCHKWILLYLLVIRPKKILVLGNYAKESLTGEISGGITGVVGYSFKFNVGGLIIPTTLCVHPSYAIYNEDVGKKQFIKGLRAFKNL